MGETLTHTLRPLMASDHCQKSLWSCHYFCHFQEIFQNWLVLAKFTLWSRVWQDKSTMIERDFSSPDFSLTSPSTLIPMIGGSLYVKRLSLGVGFVWERMGELWKLKSELGQSATDVYYKSKTGWWSRQRWISERKSAESTLWKWWCHHNNLFLFRTMTSW